MRIYARSNVRAVDLLLVVGAQVCGNDGVTYDNQCQMEAAGCVQRRVIALHSQGVCGAVRLVLHTDTRTHAYLYTRTARSLQSIQKRTRNCVNQNPAKELQVSVTITPRCIY